MFHILQVLVPTKRMFTYTEFQLQIGTCRSDRINKTNFKFMSDILIKRNLMPLGVNKFQSPTGRPQSNVFGTHGSLINRTAG